MLTKLKITQSKAEIHAQIQRQALSQSGALAAAPVQHQVWWQVRDRVRAGVWWQVYRALQRESS